MEAGSVMARSSVEGVKLEVRDAPGLRRALLAWYRKHHRKLPWRDSRDPYRIWVSEIMLQQTQVATAVPYYARFLDKFPDVTALARAHRGDVLAAWSGLGYYRRARHLHEAAGVVVREHAGSVPSDPRAFAALPGVGRYTLGAVLSMGFGRSLPVLDGNVARVFSRLTAAPVTVKRPADAKRLWDLAERLMPRAAGSSRASNPPGQWNQALMELGALVCTPRSPRCGACPVRTHCAAQARGLQHELPPVPGRRAVERVRRAVACVWDRGRLLVARRQGALLDGLWEPPGVELSRGDDASMALGARLSELGVRVRIADSGRRERHSITHRLITVEVWEGDAPQPASRATATRKWVSPGGEASLALSALAARLLAGGVSAGAANGGEPGDSTGRRVRLGVRRKSRGARAGARAPRGTAKISRASRRA